jgi:cytochrome c oxidase cbb3-type subunit 3
MRFRKFLECAFVSLGCAAGTQACEHPMTAAQRHGAELYGRMCAICHGRSGQGFAADEAPALANSDFLASVSDEQLRRAIALGRSATTMSAWSSTRGGPLSPNDIESLVAFIRSWARQPLARLDEGPRSGDADRGSAVYSKECAACHGAAGVAGPQVHIGNAQFLGDATDGYLRYAIGRGRTGTKMAGFERTLGRSGVEDTLTLLRSWQSTSSAARPGPPAPPPPLPLGPVPINARGPEPVGFRSYPATVSVDAVKKELDRGARMGILDARTPSDYVNEHIAGAVSVPFYDPNPYLNALPKSAWLVCYCACPHAESGQLAQKLLGNGFTKVTVLDEGLGVWRARKFPTQKGTLP